MRCAHAPFRYVSGVPVKPAFLEAAGYALLLIKADVMKFASHTLTAASAVFAAQSRGDLISEDTFYHIPSEQCLDPKAVGQFCNCLDYDVHEEACKACAFGWQGRFCDKCAPPWSGFACMTCHPRQPDCPCEDPWRGTYCACRDYTESTDKCNSCAAGWGGPHCDGCDENFRGVFCDVGAPSLQLSLEGGSIAASVRFSFTGRRDVPGAGFYVELCEHNGAWDETNCAPNLTWSFTELFNRTEVESTRPRNDKAWEVILQVPLEASQWTYTFGRQLCVSIMAYNHTKGLATPTDPTAFRGFYPASQCGVPQWPPQKHAWTSLSDVQPAQLCDNNECQHCGPASLNGSAPFCACSAGQIGTDCRECSPGWQVNENGSCAACKQGWKHAIQHGEDTCNTCLQNHWGFACEACSCAANVTCSDGFLGNGSCICPRRNMLGDCSDCEDGWFGPNCSEPCDCPEGTSCDQGMTGRGSCSCSAPGENVTTNCTECLAGWFGGNCTHCPCALESQCFDGRSGNGTCDCPNPHMTDTCQECLPDWYGASCSIACECSSSAVCDSGLNGTGNCFCADVRRDPDVNCSACLVQFNGENCSTCAPSWFGENCSSRCDCSDSVNCSDGLAGNGTCLCPHANMNRRCDNCADEWFGANCSELCPCHPGVLCDQGLSGTGVCFCDSSGGNVSTNCTDCLAGWFGANCTRCSCALDSQCTDGISGNGSCDCPHPRMRDTCHDCLPGWYGENCSRACNCLSGALCADGMNGSGRCSCKDSKRDPATNCTDCPAGRFGANCTRCSCALDSQCIDGISGNGSCDCPHSHMRVTCQDCLPGWYGENCSRACNCPSGALCEDGLDGSGRCACGDMNRDPATNCTDCLAGWYGENCSRACDCLTGAICADGMNGSGRCACGDPRKNPATNCTSCLGRFVDSECSECSPRWFGEDCLDMCDCSDSVNCSDGWGGNGTCLCPYSNMNSRCDNCAAGWFGENCSQRCSCFENSICSEGISASGECTCAESNKSVRHVVEAGIRSGEACVLPLINGSDIHALCSGTRVDKNDGGSSKPSSCYVCLNAGSAFLEQLHPGARNKFLQPTSACGGHSCSQTAAREGAGADCLRDSFDAPWKDQKYYLGFPGPGEATCEAILPSFDFASFSALRAPLQLVVWVAGNPANANESCLGFLLARFVGTDEDLNEATSWKAAIPLQKVLGPPRVNDFNRSALTWKAASFNIPPKVFDHNSRRALSITSVSATNCSINTLCQERNVFVSLELRDSRSLPRNCVHGDDLLNGSCACHWPWSGLKCADLNDV